MVEAVGIEPTAEPRKHEAKRNSIALNRTSVPQGRSDLAVLAEALSRLTSEDKALLAALLLGARAGGNPK
jgi:hypothetical protein